MKKYLQALKKLRKDDSGGVLIMAGLFILVTFAIAGASVDFGRAQLLQMKKQQSTDIAALAAATILDRKYADPDEETIREAAGNRYYNLNFPVKYLGVDRVTPVTDFTPGSEVITIVDTGSINTNFTNVTGTDKINVAARTVVAIPGDIYPDFDVSIVLDLSKSTNRALVTGTILAAEQKAINGMLDAIFPDGQPVNPNIRFGLVGYSGAIMTAQGLTSDKIQAKSYATNAAVKPYFQNYDHWGLEAGYKMVTGDWAGFKAPQKCPNPDFAAGYAINPSGIPCTCPAGLIPNPNTNVGGSICLAWSCPSGYQWIQPGVGQCVPERNTGVPIAVTDRNDGKKVSDAKYVVLINDGSIMEEPVPCPAGFSFINSTIYPDYRIIDTERPSAIDPVRPAGMSSTDWLSACNNYPVFEDQCKTVRDAGVTIYTINFVSKEPGDEGAMTRCAGDTSRYFYAPDAVALEGILNGIAKKIKNIRITD